MSLLNEQSERRVGRRQINHEQTPARFPEGTLKAIDAALEDGEKRSDFIRAAVEAELNRRFVHGNQPTKREPAPELTEEDAEALLPIWSR